MNPAIEAFLAKQSALRLGLITLLLLTIVGTTDFLTGHEVSFSIFYLLPVCFGAWYLGLWVGIFISLVSSVTWFYIDALAGNTYSHMSIPYWNAGVRTGFFLITSLLLVRLREALKVQAELAEKDGLTGILNSRTFRARGRALCELALRYKHPVTVCFVDIDDFKHLNDSRGHSVGDAALKAVADELCSRVRTTDLVGRMGGDEFAVLLPETNLEEAQALLDELRQRLLHLATDQGWPIGFSMGVAVFAEPPPSIEEALSLADAVMYKVKDNHKNNILYDVFSEYRQHYE